MASHRESIPYTDCIPIAVIIPNLFLDMKARSSAGNVIVRCVDASREDENVCKASHLSCPREQDSCHVIGFL